MIEPVSEKSAIAKADQYLRQGGKLGARRGYGIGHELVGGGTIGHRIDRGVLTTSIEMNHIAVILYAVPVERVRQLVPADITPETTIFEGMEMAWISVLSWQDRRAGGIEHTSYRLHVVNEGRASFLVLGLSLGSLSAVGASNLWQMPWHLSAMELQAAYDHHLGRYRSYRLHTQSQWDNARWELSDQGEAIEADHLTEKGLPSTILANRVQLLYRRTDNTPGRTEINYGDWMLTRGGVIAARSEYLERSGLLTREELSRPALVGLQLQSGASLSSWTIERRIKSLIPATRVLSHS
jgi:hypothetical protein